MKYKTVQCSLCDSDIRLEYNQVQNYCRDRECPSGIKPGWQYVDGALQPRPMPLVIDCGLAGTNNFQW